MYRTSIRGGELRDRIGVTFRIKVDLSTNVSSFFYFKKFRNAAKYQLNDGSCMQNFFW